MEGHFPLSLCGPWWPWRRPCPRTQLQAPRTMEAGLGTVHSVGRSSLLGLGWEVQGKGLPRGWAQGQDIGLMPGFQGAPHLACPG